MDPGRETQNSWVSEGHFYSTDENDYSSTDDENDENDQQKGSDEDDNYVTDEDHSDGSGQEKWSDDSEYEYYESCEVSASLTIRPQNYTILSEKDIQLRQEGEVFTIMNVMEVSRFEAVILLLSFKWSVRKVNEEWFKNEDRVRVSVGLVQPPPHQEDSKWLPEKTRCRICSDSRFVKGTKAAPKCGHFFCDTCWTRYIHTAIEDGPGCLTLRCPDPSCPVAISEDMALSLVSQEDGAKYRQYLVRSFVENNVTLKSVKWCPAPGCEYAVEYVPGAGPLDIVCKCFHRFCWNCMEETHHPVDCETAAKWTLKHSADEENANWMLANTKPCPQCNRPIEKSAGCEHMTCPPPCGFHFCWLCLEDYSTHSEETGGFYFCSPYQKAKSEGVYDEAERRREFAKITLEKYTRSYKGWASNESSRAEAVVNLQQIQKILQSGKGKVMLSQPVSKLKFVTEVWLQIAESHQILKWTYTYAYYFPENDGVRWDFFEYTQGEAEAHLNRLRVHAETQLSGLVSEDKQNDFQEVSLELVTLTKTAGTYFKSLVRELENGLAGFGGQGKIDKLLG